MSNEQYHKIPECGWPCRLDPEDTTGQTIDLNDGSSVVLEDQGAVYVWYDIDGNETDRFPRGTHDYEGWEVVHAKLIGMRSPQDAPT